MQIRILTKGNFSTWIRNIIFVSYCSFNFKCGTRMFSEVLFFNQFTANKALVPLTRKGVKENEKDFGSNRKPNHKQENKR